MIAFRITGSKVRDIQARLDSIQKRVGLSTIESIGGLLCVSLHS